MIRELRQATGTTFVIATHDPNVAQAADRAIRIVDGLVEEQQLTDVVIVPPSERNSGMSFIHQAMTSNTVPLTPVPTYLKVQRALLAVCISLPH